MPTDIGKPLPAFLQRLWTEEHADVMEVKAAMLAGIREFFISDGWLEVTPVPGLTTFAGACEDFSTLFALDYFGRTAHLIQTGQQHLELLVGGGRFDKVFAVNQSFRADKRFESRRLTSFTLIEGEARNLALSDIQDAQERLLRAVTHAATKCSSFSRFARRDSWLDTVAEGRLPRVTYSEAIGELSARGFAIGFGDEISGAAERLLTDLHGPMFVTHFPAEHKFFTMKRADDHNMTLSSDLLLPGVGEVAGSGQREDDAERLVRSLDEFLGDESRRRELRASGVDDGDAAASFAWYLALRAASPIVHSGFGVGFERLVQAVCGLGSIADAADFPRSATQLSPDEAA